MPRKTTLKRELPTMVPKKSTKEKEMKTKQKPKTKTQIGLSKTK